MGTPNHRRAARPRKRVARLIGWSIVTALLGAFLAPRILANAVTEMRWAGLREPVTAWPRMTPIDWPPPTYRFVQSRIRGVVSMYVAEGFDAEAPLDSKSRQKQMTHAIVMQEFGWPLRSYHKFSYVDWQEFFAQSRLPAQSLATCGGSPPPDLVFPDGSTSLPGLVMSEYRAGPQLINLATWFAIALLCGLGLQRLLASPKDGAPSSATRP